MKIIKFSNVNGRELSLDEKGDITELNTTEYVIRFDNKEEYEKAEPVIIEAVKLGVDVYHSQTKASKLTYDSKCGKVYATNGMTVSFTENKESHKLEEIMRKLMTTVK